MDTRMSGEERPPPRRCPDMSLSKRGHRLLRRAPPPGRWRRFFAYDHEGRADRDEVARLTRGRNDARAAVLRRSVRRLSSYLPSESRLLAALPSPFFLDL